MMRAAGLPARVVIGYQGGELNRLSRYYIVRQADAHAWTEVWLEDAVGCASIRSQPWPPAVLRWARGARSLDFGRDAVPDRRSRAPTGCAKRRSSGTQRTTIGTRGSSVTGPTPARSARLCSASSLAHASARRSLLILVVTVTLATSLALSVYLAWRYRPRAAADPAARCFAAFCRRLRRRSVPPCAPSEGPAAYAARAATALPRRRGRDQCGRGRLSASALRAGRRSVGARRAARDASRRSGPRESRYADAALSSRVVKN